MDRDLLWEGAYNARDLGGLATAVGEEVRRGAIVRAAGPEFLTARGWTELFEYGIRTIIDLRNADERHPDLAPRPVGVRTLHIPLDPDDGSEFWGYSSQGLHGTPLYFRPFLEQYPRRVAEVIKSIARADPGGVLVQCAGGRDRTQIITLVLLAFAGVPAEQIAADYALSHERLRPLFSRLGTDDHEPLINDLLAEWNTTAHREVVAAVEWLHTSTAYLRAAGLTQDDLTALRARLLNET